jgi:DNA-binding HxlR family transcriptional regulator
MSQYEHTCMIRGDGGRTIRAVPDRICDNLTPTGRSLIPPALALAGWAIEHIAGIEASRAAYGDRAG